MNFKKIEVSDIEIIRPFYNKVISRTCDFSVGGMFMWRKFYNMEYLVDGGVMFSLLRDENGKVYYNLPLSDDIEAAIKECVRRWKPKDGSISFCTIPEEYTEVFKRLYPSADITHEPMYSDYMYNAEDIIALAGKKYRSQRNQISQFMREYENYSFKDIGEVEIEEVISFFKALTASQSAQPLTGVVENEMVMEVLLNMKEYDMLGGVLTVDDKIVGFSLGERIGDTLFTHIEKADRGYKGAYQMLTGEFAKRFAATAKFINREEDMGDPGLKKAKEAYNPCCLLKKYTVEIF